MRPVSVPLSTLAHTEELGKALARAVTAKNPGVLLLYGELGAGKTTLTRALVEALPGGMGAEAASPSFTICNIYCTAPEVHHFDLYRLSPGTRDEALEESLDNPQVLTIVEWPEHLAEEAFPGDGIACRLTLDARAESRNAEFTALGAGGSDCLVLLSRRPE